MTPASQPRPPFFRANVGAVIVNRIGDVLACERNGIAGAWQLPQGGLDTGEEPLAAAIREIQEETGIGADRLELLRECPEWLSYELPAEMRSEKTGRGQTQRWFLFRYTGDETSIELPADGEFAAWQWIPLVQLAEITVSFRQPVYRRLLTEFFLLD